MQKMSKADFVPHSMQPLFSFHAKNTLKYPFKVIVLQEHVALGYTGPKVHYKSCQMFLRCQFGLTSYSAELNSSNTVIRQHCKNIDETHYVQSSSNMIVQSLKSGLLFLNTVYLDICCIKVPICHSEIDKFLSK